MNNQIEETNADISQEIKSIIYKIGEDPDRDSLKETWARRVPDMLKDLTEGYDEEEKPDMTSFSSERQEIVVKGNIPFYSLCEHHMLPFSGEVHLAYKPDGEIVGLSKLIRYVRWRSRKLHTQERLTDEIAKGLEEELDAKGVIVKVKATHMCESMRGIEAKGTETTTLSKTGVFKQKENEERFFNLLGDDHGSN